MGARIARVLAWVIVSALALLTSCALVPVALFSIFGQSEVVRVPSPNGRVDAVLVETNGGATTSFGYRVILTRHDWHWRTGRETASLYGAVRSENAYGANLEWQDENSLSVLYLRARRATEREHPTTIAGRTVTTTLRAGVSDPTAPSGGMLYNLEGRPHDERSE